MLCALHSPSLTLSHSSFCVCVRACSPVQHTVNAVSVPIHGPNANKHINTHAHTNTYTPFCPVGLSAPGSCFYSGGALATAFAMCEISAATCCCLHPQMLRYDEVMEDYRRSVYTLRKLLLQGTQQQRTQVRVKGRSKNATAGPVGGNCNGSSLCICWG